MNITLNTNQFNSQYQYNSNSRNISRKNSAISYNQPSFKGIEEIPAKSNLLNPFKRGFNRLTLWLANNYTQKLYNSKLANFLANHSKKLDGVVDHMQVIGSVVISGMYMTQTLRNKQFDDDRKRTLAVNQGLTFAFATLGSYVVDRSLDSWWEKITLKYAQKQLGNNKLGEQINKENKTIIQNAEKKLGKVWKEIPKKQRPKLLNTLKYIEDNLPDPGLESRLKGMGVLKKLIIFGSIYRFIVPVAVTPFANKLGERIAKIRHKDKTDENIISNDKNNNQKAKKA